MAPDPAEWLALDEQERIVLVERSHRKARDQAPAPQAHAAIHAAVETQLAQNEPPPVRETLTRLMAEGIDRHAAIHAIGSVLTEYVHDAFREGGGEPYSPESYARALAKLSATDWRAL